MKEGEEKRRLLLSALSTLSVDSHCQTEAGQGGASGHRSPVVVACRKQVGA